jgi:hypothetical protein
MSAVTSHEVEAAVRGLCIAQATNLGIDITMPVILPDGDFVTITVTDESDKFLVHDSSSAVMSLAAMGAKTSSDVRKKYIPLVSRFGCEMDGDRIQRRVDKDHIGMAAVMVANAARSVADTVLEMRRRTEHDFRHAVSERIREVVGPRVRFNQEVKGASGRLYHVQNMILDAEQRTPIALVESLSHRAAVANQFTEFFDIKEALERISRACIYDDSSDIRDMDLRLLNQVSDVVPFAQATGKMAEIAA